MNIPGCASTPAGSGFAAVRKGIPVSRRPDQAAKVAKTGIGGFVGRASQFCEADQKPEHRSEPEEETSPVGEESGGTASDEKLPKEWAKGETAQSVEQVPVKSMGKLASNHETNSHSGIINTKVHKDSRLLEESSGSDQDLAPYGCQSSLFLEAGAFLGVFLAKRAEAEPVQEDIILKCAGPQELIDVSMEENGFYRCQNEIQGEMRSVYGPCKNCQTLQEEIVALKEKIIIQDGQLMLATKQTGELGEVNVLKLELEKQRKDAAEQLKTQDVLNIAAQEHMSRQMDQMKALHDADTEKFKAAAAATLRNHQLETNRIIQKLQADNAELQQDTSRKIQKREAENIELQQEASRKVQKLEAENAELHQETSRKIQKLEVEHAELQQETSRKIQKLEAENAELQEETSRKIKSLEAEKAELLTLAQNRKQGSSIGDPSSISQNVGDAREENMTIENKILKEGSKEAMTQVKLCQQALWKQQHLQRDQRFKDHDVEHMLNQLELVTQSQQQQKADADAQKLKDMKLRAQALKAKHLSKGEEPIAQPSSATSTSNTEPPTINVEAEELSQTIKRPQSRNNIIHTLPPGALQPGQMELQHLLEIQVSLGSDTAHGMVQRRPPRVSSEAPMAQLQQNAKSQQEQELQHSHQQNNAEENLFNSPGQRALEFNQLSAEELSHRPFSLQSGSSVDRQSRLNSAHMTVCSQQLVASDADASYRVENSDLAVDVHQEHHGEEEKEAPQSLIEESHSPERAVPPYPQVSTPLPHLPPHRPKCTPAPRMRYKGPEGSPKCTAAPQIRDKGPAGSAQQSIVTEAPHTIRHHGPKAAFAVAHPPMMSPPPRLAKAGCKDSFPEHYNHPQMLNQSGDDDAQKPAWMRSSVEDEMHMWSPVPVTDLSKEASKQSTTLAWFPEETHRHGPSPTTPSTVEDYRQVKLPVMVYSGGRYVTNEMYNEVTSQDKVPNPSPKEAHMYRPLATAFSSSEDQMQMQKPDTRQEAPIQDAPFIRPFSEVSRHDMTTYGSSSMRHSDEGSGFETLPIKHSGECQMRVPPPAAIVRTEVYTPKPPLSTEMDTSKQMQAQEQCSAWNSGQLATELEREAYGRRAEERHRSAGAGFSYLDFRSGPQDPRLSQSKICYTDFSIKGDPNISILSLDRQQSKQADSASRTFTVVQTREAEDTTRSGKEEKKGKEFQMFKLETRDGASVLREFSPIDGVSVLEDCSHNNSQGSWQDVTPQFGSQTSDNQQQTLGSSWVTSHDPSSSPFRGW
eukprot:gnl/MRDRNA2_/MRDRNA2_97489_c0_seq1.p1 gnl/MRDRNA2_/MRDRNA2_97489_c0~~gnl/MRDRNA2_/MRDRNA2_97489_c0_seq1.p1  ORF type:complete len:1257 (-),score=296.79 gnl/MRDRNA2_/MRDRNA2_97489_c0_seq1:91-3861(-)